MYQLHADNKIKVTDDFVFFYYGWLSQWHPSEFKVGDITYNCAEQFMMAEKARLFKDKESRKKILSTKDPKTHQALGRKVSNFNQTIWGQHAKEIVFLGNLAKFSQNKELMDRLLSIGDKALVEASPYDTIWGIGLSMDDPNVENYGKWTGRNWLGKCLTRVKHVLNYEWLV